MIRASELRTNLAAKHMPSFLDEVRPLLRPGVAYDPGAALDWVEATFITVAVRHSATLHAQGLAGLRIMMR